jgi:hypothetical protein
LRFGPLLGVGLPNLVNFGATLKLTRYFGAGANIGLIPTVRMPNYGDAEVSYQEYDAYARVYPFGGGFFVSGGLGYARAEGTYSKRLDISSYADQYPQLDLGDVLASSSRGSVRTLVMPLQLGFFQIFDSGFCMGADVGAQIPVAASRVDVETSTDPDVPEAIREQFVTPGEDEVRETIENVAATPIPTFNFRIGWML